MDTNTTVDDSINTNVNITKLENSSNISEAKIAEADIIHKNTHSHEMCRISQDENTENDHDKLFLHYRDNAISIIAIIVNFWTLP